MPEPGIKVSDSAELWRLDVNITYNSSHPLGPEYDNNPENCVPSIKVILYDSTVPLDYPEIFTTCGVPPGRPLGHAITLPAVTASSEWPTYVDTFRINDAVGELKSNAVDGIFGSMYVRDFKYYNGEPPRITWDRQQGIECDVGKNGTAPCQFSLPFTFSSPLVTVETSKRGTDALKIFTDEGSILGAILFITWFLGIFIN
ncbi:structural constituent of ribosome [Hypoxylon texense]